MYHESVSVASIYVQNNENDAHKWTEFRRVESLVAHNGDLNLQGDNFSKPPLTTFSLAPHDG